MNNLYKPPRKQKMVSPSSERLAQLRAFDETKLGVKGLVDAGVTTIPPIFVHPFHDSLPCKTTNNTSVRVPTIDLGGVGVEEEPSRRKDTVERIREALETWGFFQVVNHGIPEMVLEEMLDGTRAFFEQDDEVKKRYYSRDYGVRKLIYNSNFDLYSGLSTNWRDTFGCVMAPHPPKPEELPIPCREILMEYSEKVMQLGKMLFELLSEALGLQASYLNEIGCSEGLQALGHYYPACPQPELTIGVPRHADNDFLTILLQDQIGGLQLLSQNEWIDIPPTPGALVINIGDLLQLITNDKFKSSEHRVLANIRGPRMSVAAFFTTALLPSTRVYGPIKDLISGPNPARYRETTVKDYTVYFRNKGLDGSSALQNYRL